MSTLMNKTTAKSDVTVPVINPPKSPLILASSDNTWLPPIANAVLKPTIMHNEK